ncbi:2'-5' RNA ligase family protein [Cryobacterium sp. SO2]|uniref:2'-5' RNA ligase family protein n=1 Tax=Cryobacterium sp. SO2 TaxID=1897060 RepID=UPI00223D114C|nr:2'-5' RNA ligase family protein [Cryobacterium sp. SO2]WEO78586.1 2'-5' RNA ligase family protein [Cryobacterium sp. SO2]
MRSIELTFDLATEAAFTAEWAALQDAGLPNLGRHQGASNRPHLTLAAGPALEIKDALQAVFGPDPQRAGAVLPVDLRVSGVVLFRAGSGRFVLARPVVMTRALLELHRAVLELAPGAVELTQPDRWTPHVTLARRLSADQVTEALAVLGEPPAVGSCVAARFWNGETKTLTALAG